MMSSLARRAAEEESTFSPLTRRGVSFKISMLPLEILEEMLSAWRKEVMVGSREVGPAGIMTSTCAMAPALAAVGILFDTIFSHTVAKSPLVKTRAMLSLQI